MYCHNCGAELPDDANFCSKCGKPQSAAAAEPPAAAKTWADGEWESCEIVASVVGEKLSPVFPGDYIRFKAQGVGARGSYNVLESATVHAGLADYYAPNKQNKRHAKALEALKAALAEAGWEPAGKGESWFSYRFRRRPVARQGGEDE